MQIAEDSASGELDFLVQEALEAKKRIHSGNYKCIEDDNDYTWVWIGTHDEYERMI